MVKSIKHAITFDDVLLVPKFSRVRSRKDVDTSTKLSARIVLKIPIVSANMDSVTESAMAIVLAREGGIGIIHRFLSIQDQVADVVKVKRSESIFIEQPYTISAESTVAEAKELMERYGVGGILVTEKSGKLKGMVTRRDIIFEENGKTKLSEVMTKDLVTARPGTKIEEAKEILKANKIEKLPVVDRKGYLKGLITAKDIVKSRQYPSATKDEKGRLRVGAAVGVRGDFLERARALVDAGTDVIVVDVAHGHSENVMRAISAIRNKLGDVELIAGNVATKEGVRDLIDAGVDGVKVGVGAGSICVTRVVTGAGVPQLSAVLECSEVALQKGMPMIADGGIRNSGDLTKALAAGSSSVMIGSLLAGTDESPGFPVLRHGGKFKVTRGMASLGATLNRQFKDEKDWDPSLFGEMVPEGVEGFVPYKGSAVEVVRRLVGGLRSGMSYCGASSLAEMRRNSEFVRMSEAGLRESLPHDVEIIR